MKIIVNFDAVLDHTETIEKIEKKSDTLIELLNSICETMQEEAPDLANRLRREALKSVYGIRDNAKSRKALLRLIVEELRAAHSTTKDIVQEISANVSGQTGRI